MTDNIYNTTNFSITYKSHKYNNNIILELYRKRLYNKLLKRLNKIRKKYLKKLIKKNPHINLNNNNLYLSNELSMDIFSILIMDMTNKKDPIFNDKSPFDKELLIKYFNVNKCIKTLKPSIIESIIYIFPQLSKKYISYYHKLTKKNITKTYDINYEINDKNVKITLNISDTKLLIIPLHIFNHLIKNYNIKNYNIHDDSKLIINDNVILDIYILFTRYMTISNGNNQASILPSFKKLIKEKLNIKVELFGSPLNTSYTTFGSYFYDTDNLFGSIGNFFDMNIIKGYYEINPPFDSCIINNIFKNCLNFLITAENNKLPLLFLFIIPETYFKNNLNMNISFFNDFLKFNILLKKEQFPYIRYSRDFKNTVVSPIVPTRLFICSTNNMTNYISSNINNFNDILNNWINKNSK